MGLRGVPMRLRGVPMGLRDVPMGLRDVPMGLRGVPMGLRDVPMGLRGVPMGLRGVPMGLRDVPMGLREVACPHDDSSMQGMSKRNAYLLVCGMAASMALGAPLRGQDVHLGIERTPEGLEATASCGEGTYRLVWEYKDLLRNDWLTFATSNVTNGLVRVPIAIEDDHRFVRALPKPTPGFLERLGTVRGKVIEAWPEAALLEAHLLMDDWVVSYPDALPVRGVFRVDMGTVTAVEETPGGDVAMEFNAMPWLGSQTLEWPIAMEVEVALSRMFAASWGSLFRTLTLRQPIYPGMTEPYWIFKIPDGGFVFVGSKTGALKRG